MKTQADLSSVQANERGLFEEIKQDASDALDFFTGVEQKDVSKDPTILDRLSREDRIELIVDGQTSSIFGSSPWSPALQLDASVADQIHLDAGGTLVFSADAGTGVIDAVEGLLTTRYALVWDDSIVVERGNLSINPVGQTFLIVGVANEPRGKVLTLWVTDNDVRVRIVKQAPLKDLEAVRRSIIGELGDAAGNPLAQAANAFLGFATATQVGGIVVVVVVAVVLIALIRSEAFKDVAATAARVTA